LLPIFFTIFFSIFVPQSAERVYYGHYIYGMYGFIFIYNFMNILFFMDFDIYNRS